MVDAQPPPTPAGLGARGRPVAGRARVAKCKGNTILQVKKALERDFDTHKLEAILARCGPETRELIGGIILSTQFYPEHLFADFVQAAFDVLGGEACRAYTRTIAKRQISAFFQVLLRLFVSPRRFSENNHKLWSALHDSGTLEVLHGPTNKYHVVVIADFDFVTHAYEQLFIEYHCAVLELTGARNARGTSSVRTPEGGYRIRFDWE